MHLSQLAFTHMHEGENDMHGAGDADYGGQDPKHGVLRVARSQTLDQKAAYVEQGMQNNAYPQIPRPAKDDRKHAAYQEGISRLQKHLADSRPVEQVKEMKERECDRAEKHGKKDAALLFSCYL